MSFLELAKNDRRRFQIAFLLSFPSISIRKAATKKEEMTDYSY